MIRHIVMFKLKADLPEKEQHLQKIVEMSNILKEELACIIDAYTAINASFSDSGNYDVVITCDFNDIDGLNEYQTHPKHVEFGQYLATIREARACVDFEI